MSDNWCVWALVEVAETKYSCSDMCDITCQQCQYPKLECTSKQYFRILTHPWGPSSQTCSADEPLCGRGTGLGSAWLSVRLGMWADGRVGLSINTSGGVSYDFIHCLSLFCKAIMILSFTCLFSSKYVSSVQQIVSWQKPNLTLLCEPLWGRVSVPHHTGCLFDGQVCVAAVAFLKRGQESQKVFPMKSNCCLILDSFKLKFQ